ncbi:MAG: formate/nitrite transporter family protein [Muribaculaceae bacterium]|nr:formate/nitrite transporter family protein [Muribaculaceae bacterium]
MNTPSQTTDAAITVGKNKLTLSNQRPARLAASAFLAGCYIALGGALSLIIGFGFPEISASNPGLQKILSGAMFPIGLILIVTLGAELFTGNNALLIPAYMTRQCSLKDIIRNWVMVYVGNFFGAVTFTVLLVYYAGLTDADIYRNAATGIAQAKVSMPWGVVFVKGIGANWCVCMGVWMALTARTFTGKILGCWIPVMAFVAFGYEHCIANMFYFPLGMLHGADVTIMEAITRNMIPSTLGNIAGGALMVGTIKTYIHFKKQ